VSTTETMPSTIEREVAEISQAIGEDAGKIRVKAVDWKRLLQDGVSVSLSVGRWRAQSKLTLADLGIDPGTPEERKAREAIINLGSRLLMPRDWIEKLEKLESKGRYALEFYSLKTTLAGQKLRFVRSDNYEAWAERNGALRDEYLAVASEMADRWDIMVDAMTQAYREVGQSAYRRLQQAGVDDLPGRAEWVNRYVRRVVGQIVSADEFRRSVYWSHDAEYLPLPSSLAQDEAQAAMIRAETETRIEIARLTKMEQDVLLTQARKAKDDLQTAVADVQADLMGQVYDAVVDVLEAVKKGDSGKLGRNSTKQLLKTIEAVERLKFWPDESLEAKIGEIRRLVAIPSDKRPMRDVTKVLRALGAETKLVLTELDRPPSRTSKKAGIPDDAVLLERMATGRRSAPTLDDAKLLVETLPERVARRKASDIDL
jgi:hypothetical protein